MTRATHAIPALIIGEDDYHVRPAVFLAAGFLPVVCCGDSGPTTFGRRSFLRQEKVAAAAEARKERRESPMALILLGRDLVRTT
jgi:hypothetical protein